MFSDNLGELYLCYSFYVKDCEKNNKESKSFLRFISDCLLSK